MLCFSQSKATGQSLSVLGGTLSWTTTSGYEPCGGGQFQIMTYTSFTWQYGGTVYPISGSTAYIFNSPAFQCPQDGPRGDAYKFLGVSKKQSDALWDFKPNVIRSTK